MTETKCSVFRFSDVEVHERELQLKRGGEALPVEPKAFRVLVHLLRNPGRLIRKDELLNAGWGDTAVTDNSLTRNIALLRRLLDDDTRAPRYIETVSTVGYRFICPVETIENPTVRPEAAVAAGNNGGGSVMTVRPTVLPVIPAKSERHWRRWLWPTPAALAAVALTVVIAALFAWRSLPGQPTIESVLQLTDDGNPKLLTSALLSDGFRIYFNELRAGSLVIAQVAVSGGETGQMVSRIPSPTLAALAMDSSSLLALGESYFVGPLWLLPLPAGEPRQLRNVVAQNASFTPDGHLIFSKDASLYIAEKDGSNPRKLCDLPSHISSPVVSPDGKRIRLTVETDDHKSLWEVDSDGNNAHPLLPGWQGEGADCCGRWTSDGKYFVFQSRSKGRTDLWAIREGNRWSARSSSPLRLTNGPLSYELPYPSPDGRHIFAMGVKPRGELVRFERSSQQFVPYLSGISALDATVSRDGKWVTYTTYPDGNLWRSRTDGSERLQLTYAPTEVAWPRISPDGTRVAYSSWNVSCSWCVYVLPLEGGTPTKVAENAIAPSWSPDSSSVVATFIGKGKPSKICSVTSFAAVETINLRTGKITSIPDSRQMGGPNWPSNDMLVAPILKPGEEGFVTFDFKTQKWSLLVKGFFQHWMTSVDGEYLYLMTRGEDPKIQRVRLSNGTLDTVASLKSSRPLLDEDTGMWLGMVTEWLGVAADGSPVLTRDIGTQEVYDLTARWH